MNGKFVQMKDSIKKIFYGSSFDMHEPRMVQCYFDNSVAFQSTYPLQPIQEIEEKISAAGLDNVIGPYWIESDEKFVEIVNNNRLLMSDVFVMCLSNKKQLTIKGYFKRAEDATQFRLSFV